MVVVVLRCVAPWLGRWGACVVCRCTLPKVPVVRRVCLYGDRDFLVFWDVSENCYYSFGRLVCEVIAFYVCVSSYFVGSYGKA